MNWSGQRFTFQDVDGSAEVFHYFRDVPGGSDFGSTDAAARGIRAISLSVEDGNEAPRQRPAL